MSIGAVLGGFAAPVVGAIANYMGNSSLQEDAQSFNREEAIRAAQRQYEYWNHYQDLSYASPQSPTQQNIDAYEKDLIAIKMLAQRMGASVDDFLTEGSIERGGREIKSLKELQQFHGVDSTGGYQYMANNASLDYATKAVQAYKEGLINAGFNPLSAIDSQSAAMPSMQMSGDKSGQQAHSGGANSFHANMDIAGAIAALKTTDANVDNIKADTQLKEAQAEDIKENRQLEKQKYELDIERYNLDKKRLDVDQSKIELEKRHIENVIDLDSKKYSQSVRQEIAGYIDKALKHGETIAGLIMGLKKIGAAVEQLNALTDYFKTKTNILK